MGNVGSILQGQAYSSMPDRSGTIVAVSNIFGLAGRLLPLGLGLVSTAWGLNIAMWLLLAGPIALLISLTGTGPHRSGERVPRAEA